MARRISRKWCFMIALIMMGFSGCVSDSEYAELEKRVERLESIIETDNHSVDTALDDQPLIESENVAVQQNLEYRNATTIYLYCDYNGKTSTSGKYYQLILDNDASALIYNDSLNPGVVCYFSRKTYEDLLDLICSQQLEPFKFKSDENGKIIYETVPYTVGLYLSPKEGTVFFETPLNIEEIVAEFERMKEAAME